MTEHFRMPAEWAPHRATWIAWPHNTADWPGKFAPIPWAYAEIVRVLARHERVGILTLERPKAEAVLRKAGADLSKVDFLRCPTDRVWTRDSGAIFVKDARGRKVATHWKFNGWAKYPNHKLDDKVPDRIARLQKRKQLKPMVGKIRVVLEGGSIDVNGAGTLLTTEECLLSPIQARNPKLSKDDLEKVLGESLGIKKVLWLGEGIAGDDTHGHVDDLARFTDENTVVVAQEEDPTDANFVLARDPGGMRPPICDGLFPVAAGLLGLPRDFGGTDWRDEARSRKVGTLVRKVARGQATARGMISAGPRTCNPGGAIEFNIFSLAVNALKSHSSLPTCNLLPFHTDDLP